MPIEAKEPSLLNPLDWLRSKLQEFFTLPARIAALRLRGERLATIADQRAKPAVAAQVRQAAAELSTTQTMHQAVQGKLNDLFAALGRIGVRLPGMSGYEAGASELGIIPLAVLALAGAVAIAIYGVFRHYNNQERVIKAAETGLLTPEEADRLLGGLRFDLGGALKPLVLVGAVVAAVLFWPQLRRAFARG